MLFGNNLTLLEIDARHLYASTVDYKGTYRAFEAIWADYR